jgi:prephenate dehydrogenase
MTAPSHVAVIGLGLMGGSLARELAARNIVVCAYDRDPVIVEEARRTGIVQTVLGPDLQGVEDVEIVVIATPVDVAIDLLERSAPWLGSAAVVTDVGSTKRSIAARSIELGIAHAFVGSHPLTGDHRAGWAASRAHLYAGTHVFLCPTPATDPVALRRIDSFWEMLGASREIIDPAEHDRRMAWLSHLPQIVSSSLAGVLATAGYHPADLGPGGRDVTRLAGSSRDMWRAICLDNADYIAAAVTSLQDRLERFRIAMEEGNASALHDIFDEGRDWSG